MITPLREMLIKHEGMRLKPYRDTVGKLTIGVGRNLDDVGISEAEATMLLENDIFRALASARKEFPWFDELNDVRKCVVVDMIFNLGIGGFKGFKNMITAIEAKDWTRAAAEMASSRWAWQVKSRAVELGKMMKEGAW